MKRVIGVMLMVLVLSGCSSLSVVTDYSEEADFSKFKTFQYKESTMTLADTFPLAHRRVVNAIRGEMIAAGLTEVDSEPDVYMTYYGEENENIIIMTTGREYDTPGNWHRTNSASRRVRGAGSLHQSTTQEVTIREGNILIDMWETKNKELVWRAEISDTISSNPDRNTANIKNGIARAFENFPPVSGN